MTTIEKTPKLGANRRQWLVASAAWTQGLLPTSGHAHASPGTVPVAGDAALLDTWAQPLLAMAQRVAQTLARLGEPLPPPAQAEVDALQAAGDIRAAARAALAALQERTLLAASITPEARVSVRRRRTLTTLVQGGWRLALVEVDNPGLVPGRLGATSPNAVPVHGVEPPGPAGTGINGPTRIATTRGDLALRWLGLQVHDEASFPAELEPLPLDYKILLLYARDAGRRSARLSLNIGPGTADLGGRAEVDIGFNVLPARAVQLGVKDIDGQAVTCSWLITDEQGRVLPSPARRSPPDMFFQQKVYRADGQTLLLPPGRYQVVVGRGPEYLVQQGVRHVPAAGPTRWTASLQRWIDPGARGWISGDHHIHAAGCAHYEHPEEGVGPEVLLPQLQGEAVAIGAVLTWAPGFHTQKLHFRGQDDPVSTASQRLHYDLEVSGFPSSHCGHLALLQLKSMDYPGARRIEEWPSSNAPVLRWARSQRAVAGYAHAGVGLWAGSTELPNDLMPSFNGIGANDYIVTLPEGLVDFIGICNHPPAAELNIWYHTLNVGLRSTIAGETDWPCFYEESLGMGRSYVKLDGPLSYADWCQGLRAGRSYVSEGRAHLMDFMASAGGQIASMGRSDLKLDTPLAITLQADAAARLEPAPTPETESLRRRGPMDKPYWHIERARVGDTRQVIVELVVNGLPVEARAMPADGAIRRLQFEFTPACSCWFALRILGAAHTNPIWVSVADGPIRARRSAEWCRAAVDQCWSQKVLRIRQAERTEEALLYERARRFYERMASEATS